jgi:multidrug resistance efflux pump
MKKTTLIVAVGLLAAVVVSLGFFWPFSRRHRELVLPGTVEVFEIRLASKVGGRVEDVLVREGDEVDAGTELVRFEAPELRAQIAQYEARLAGLKADLLKAEHGPRPQEKDEAKAQMESAEAKNRRMIAGWRDEEKRQAKYDKETAEADLELTRRNFERVQGLFNETPPRVTQSEFDTARLNYRAALGRANSARTKFEMLEKGNRTEDLADAAAAAEQAKAHYNLLLAGTRLEDIDFARAQVAEIEGKLKELKANLAETVIKAPSRIIVEVLAVRKGDVAAANQPAIRALSVEDRWVKVFVPSTELGKIRIGQDVEVTGDAFPGKRFPGKVIQIATISEFTPRNVQSLDERKHQVFGVKVQVHDEGKVFKAGMAAEVHVPLQESP